MSSVRESIISFVLRNESSSSRFEDFCNAILGQLEGGRVILSTSKTYDMGRDGRSLGGEERVYSCVSLNDHPDSKAKKDIARISVTTRRIDKLFFCSSQEITESKADKIQAEIRKNLPPETDVEVCGVGMLVQLAVKFGDIFERFYKAELEQSLSLLSGPVEQSAPEHNSLQLALATVGHESSESIRAEVYRGSLRRVLLGQGKTLGECCKLITDLLGLHLLLPVDALLPQLQDMISVGEVTTHADVYSLTEAGKLQADAQQASAFDSLAQGRQSIRQQIEKGLGHQLADDHFERVWRILQDKLAHFFFLRGQEMVLSVSRLLGKKDLSPVGEDLREPLFFIDDIAESIAGTASGPLAEELRVASKDLFQDPVGPAFDWLTGVCGAFVVLCSLGIEAESGDVIGRILAKTDLVLDTDVCLSLLGQGEMHHEAVESVVRRWKILGGGLWISKEVLEELSYHAYIADIDFQNVEKWLPGSTLDRMHLIENVFVRSFAELLESRGAVRSHWNSYINQFRGAHKYDIENIASLMRDEYGFNLLPGHSSEDEVVREKAREYLTKRIVGLSDRSDDIRNAEDKARRDAALFASLTAFRREMRRRDSERSCLFVSSARRMGELEHQLAAPGDPSLVVSVAMIVHLTSLAPKVSIGLKSMRTFLFEKRKASFTSDLERVVLRVVRDSKEFHMPWAKRTTLVREVRKRLVDNAKRAGVARERRDSELFSRLAENREIEPLTEILRESLNAVAVDRRVEIENAELRRRVEELSEEVERLKSPRTSGRTKRR